VGIRGAGVFYVFEAIIDSLSSTNIPRVYVVDSSCCDFSELAAIESSGLPIAKHETPFHGDELLNERLDESAVQVRGKLSDYRGFIHS